MANNRLVMAGLNEWKAAMLKLPTHLADEGRDIVLAVADEAKTELVAAYPVRQTGLHPGPRRTSKWAPPGNLRKGVRVNKVSNPFGTRAIVGSYAPHAWLYENGSEARHWANDKSTGAMWGKSAPTHIAVKTFIRKRREMQGKLIEMMQREGLVVSGQ